MGLWDNTAYANTEDRERLAAALTDVFAVDGYRPTGRPAVRQPAPYDSMQYGSSGDNPLWAVALVAGRGWTAIKTAPFELLCERADGARRPRLADVSEALQCDAFQVNVYDGDSAILLEATSTGQHRVSGFNASDGELALHDEPILEENLEVGFGLLELEGSAADALDEVIEGVPLAFAQALLGVADVDDWYQTASNLVQVQYLIPHRPTSSRLVCEHFFAAR